MAQKKSSGTQTKKSAVKNTASNKTKSNNTQGKKQASKQQELKNPLTREIIIISMFALGVLMLILLFGSGSGIGKYVSGFLKGMFGIGSVLIPIVLIGGAIYGFLDKQTNAVRLKGIFATAFVICLLGLIHCFTYEIGFQASGLGNYINFYFNNGSFENAGLIGAITGGLFMKLVGKIAAVIILLALVIIFLMLLTGISVFGLINKAKAYIMDIATEREELYREYEENIDERLTKEKIPVDKEIKKAEKPQMDKTKFRDIEDIDYLTSQSRYNKRKGQVIEEMHKRRQSKNQSASSRTKKSQDKNYFYDERGRVMTIKLEQHNRSAKAQKLTLFTDEFKTYTTATEELLKSRARHEPRINGVPAGYQEPLAYGHDITINSKPVSDPDYMPQENQEYSAMENGAWEQGPVYETIMESAENVKENVPRTRNIPVIPAEFLPNDEGMGVFDYSEDRGFEADQIYFDYDEYSDDEEDEQSASQVYDEERPKIDLDAIENSYINEEEDFKPVYSDYDEDEEALPKGVAEDFDFSSMDYPELPELDQSFISQYDNDEDDEVLQAKAVKPVSSKGQAVDEQELIKQSIIEEKRNNTLQEDLPPWEEQPLIIEAEKTKTLDKLKTDVVKSEYKFPKLEFLGKNPNMNNELSRDDMLKKAKLLEDTLKSFGVDAKVNNISKGPTVTRFELTPSIGTRVNKIVSLEEDMALNLAAKSIRIEAPIPGMSAIGIELPNDKIMSVYFSEILQNEKFQDFKSKLAFGIGKDITGNVVVYDIAKMPHMLVAGATGAGKSVCINTLITSILYKATPDEVKLIMVDPKVVELSVYNGIPHLLIPVVTDPKKASGALNWAVAEMERRYELFAQTGTRNLEGYNAKLPQEERVPQIVIIIDELADLMMVAKKNVETAICRLAQLARAAGIHLIIATQRPSVDVITGLIKANIPSRIAFKVSSAVDSRTILDSGGAEKLLGRGDMLFKAVDMNQPLRVQGAFVTDEEVERIVDYIKVDDYAYDPAVIEQIERASSADEEGEATGSSDGGSDDLVDDVIDFIVKKGKASTSLIQRQFRIGFNKAARIVDELEERGIVGPENGSKPRVVLMDKSEWREYKERHDNY